MEITGLLKAETRLEELLDKVERGESFVPPPAPADERNRAKVMRDLLDFGNG